MQKKTASNLPMDVKTSKFDKNTTYETPTQSVDNTELENQHGLNIKAHHEEYVGKNQAQVSSHTPLY